MGHYQIRRLSNPHWEIKQAGPNHWETYAPVLHHTYLYIFCYHDGMCMCVYVYNRQSERDSTSVCNRKRQGKLKGWLILVKYFQLQGCPLQKGSCTAFSGRSKCGRIPLLMYMFVQLSGVHGRCHNTYNVALREPWGISPSSSVTLSAIFIHILFKSKHTGQTTCGGRVINAH